MANKTITTLETLKSESIKLYQGITIVYPCSRQEENLDLSELTPRFNGCFASNHSTVCFISDNKIFATPYRRVVENTLLSLGFRKESFYVPFSNWDYPKFEYIEWECLREKARKAYQEDFVDDCIEYSDKHHIGAISDETLKNCFEMPETGVNVKFNFYEDCYYPVVHESYWYCMQSVGHYCANNGKVLFVYRNSKTYVAKGYKIIEELRDAGYKQFNCFVPFSNGEKILNPDVRARWEAIIER